MLPEWLGWIIGGAAFIFMLTFPAGVTVGWSNDLGHKPMPLRSPATVFVLMVGATILGYAALLWMI